MGLIEAILGVFLGQGRNVIKETAEVFRENAETAGARDLEYRNAALKEFAAEFAVPRRGMFDRFMDALNRLPRPALALGTLGLFLSAMIDPVWFAARMQGVALVPDPLWWLLGAIVSFYFGARHQSKSQEFQQSIAQTMARVDGVTRNLRALDALSAGAKIETDEPQDTPSGPNPALDSWRRENGF